MPRELLELEPDEELLIVSRASFRGAAAASFRSTFALGSGRMRMKAYDTWHDAAIGSGFPPAPPEMFVAATDRRVLFGKPTFWGARPGRTGAHSPTTASPRSSGSATASSRGSRSG